MPLNNWHSTATLCLNSLSRLYIHVYMYIRGASTITQPNVPTTFTKKNTEIVENTSCGFKSVCNPDVWLQRPGTWQRVWGWRWGWVCNKTSFTSCPWWPRLEIQAVALLTQRTTLIHVNFVLYKQVLSLWAVVKCSHWVLVQDNLTEHWYKLTATYSQLQYSGHIVSIHCVVWINSLATLNPSFIHLLQKPTVLMNKASHPGPPNAHWKTW